MQLSHNHHEVKMSHWLNSKNAETKPCLPRSWLSHSSSSRSIGCCLVGTLLLSTKSNAYQTQVVHTGRGLFGPAIASTVQLHKRRKNENGVFSRSRHATNSLLRMVLTTPESIIEQASTQKLLDILIDESVRTTARRPIMLQVRMLWLGQINSMIGLQGHSNNLFASSFFP
jgi:hypothetical protein